MNVRISVRAIVVDVDKLFCVRHKAYDDTPERTFWCTPGGGIDEGEDLKQALEREITEEVGIKPIIGNLLYIQQYQDKKQRQHIEFFFHVTNTSDFNKIDIEKASHFDVEIAESDFISKKEGKEILPKFLIEEDIESHIQSNSPTKVFSYIPHS